MANILKVSCFLNGDGIANIIHADGLDTFDSEAYQNAPLLHLKKNTKDNPNFDILVANPPYSVSAFIKTLAKGKESFDMYDAFTEQGKEIECLFIERTKQITKENSLVGIVLPSSILNNAGVYSLAREVILKYFKIVSIVEFGSSTFMATGTNTITLFLKRRKDTDFKNIQDAIQQFFKDGNDTVCNGIENAFSNYIQHVYKLQLVDYVSFIQQKSNEQISQTELYQDYQKYYNNLSETKNLKDRIVKLKHELSTLKLKTVEEKIIKKITETEVTLVKAEKDLIRLFYEKIFAIEQEKILYFMLAYPQEIVLIKTNPAGNNDQEKEFLGYEFSNRRGHEGIKMFSDAQGNFTTKLYHETDRKDITKANSYVYNAFLGNTQMPVHESLKENIQTQKLYEMMKFDRVVFEKEITISFKKKVLTEIKSKWELVRLGEICNIKIGGTPDTDNRNYYFNGNNLWVSIGDMKGQVLFDTKTKINDLGVEKSNVKLIRAGTTLISFKLSIGKMAIAGVDLFTNEAIAGLEVLSDLILSDRFLFYYFSSFSLNDIETDNKKLGKVLNSKDLQNFKIPLPPKFIQEKIVKEILEIETEEMNSRVKLESLEQDIWTLLLPNFQSGQKEKLGIIAKLERGRFSHRPRNAPHLYRDGTFPFIQTGDVAGAINTKVKYSQTLNEEGLKVSRLFDPNTILITIAANIGNTAILDYPACFPDSVVSIRPNENVNIYYLEYFLRTQKEYLNEIAPQSAQKNLNLERLSPLLIPIIPLAQQNEIISQIKILEIQKQEIEQFLNTIQEQKEEVLKKYLYNMFAKVKYE